MIKKINTKQLRPDSSINLSGPLIPTSNLILNDVFFAGGVLSAPNVYTIRCGIFKNGTSDQTPFGLYWNTTLTFGGATLLSSFGIPVSSIQYYSCIRRIYFDSTSTAKILNPSFSGATDQGTSTGILSTITITDWLTTSGYFFVGVTGSPSFTNSVGGLFLTFET